jgi:hypothetical protein
MAQKLLKYAVKVGTRIGLAGSRSASGYIHGSAVLKAVLGPLSAEEWEDLRPLHLVQGPRFYVDRTFAYIFSDVRRCMPRIPLTRNQGSVSWQNVAIDLSTVQNVPVTLELREVVAVQEACKDHTMVFTH